MTGVVLSTGGTGVTGDVLSAGGAGIVFSAGGVTGVLVSGCTGTAGSTGAGAAGV